MNGLIRHKLGSMTLALITAFVGSARADDASAYQVYFEDNFDGTVVDATKWNTDIATSGKRWCSSVASTAAPGHWQDVSVEPWYAVTQTPPYGAITVAGGLAKFSSGTSRAFPFIWSGPPSRPSPFPSAGDYILEFRMRFDSLETHGSGFVYRFSEDADPEGDASPWTSNWGLWGDSGGGGINAPHESIAVVAPFVFHDYRLEYIDGEYSLLIDGVLSIGPTASGTRLNSLWMGNPFFTHWQIADWTDFTLDFVRVTVPLVLSFPLASRTPYTAVITSAFDHRLVTKYVENGSVEAFTGEVGDNEKDPGDDGIDGYSNSDGTPFRLHGHYAYGADEPYLYYDGHPAIDYRTIDQDPGSGEIPVFAAAPGVAHIIEDQWNTVIIDHGNGYASEYLHMSFRDPLMDGQQVTRGQSIGVSGRAGAGDNPHLHFGLLYRPSPSDAYVPIDPYGWQGAPGGDPYTETSGIEPHNYWGSIAEAWVNPNPVVEPELGDKLGTSSAPYTLVAEAQNHVASGGTIYIYTGWLDETPRIEKPMRLEAVGGTVTIGSSPFRSEEAETERTGFIAKDAFKTR